MVYVRSWLTGNPKFAPYKISNKSLQIKEKELGNDQFTTDGRQS